MQCPRHPDVETHIACSKCGKPICPRCLVQTPVGARCRECAHARKVPTYTISTRYYLRAVAGGLGAALAYGILWGLVMELTFSFLFDLLLGLGAGFIISEAVSLSTNRKRGMGLVVLASVLVIVSYFMGTFSPVRQLATPSGIMFNVTDLLSIALGIIIAVNKLR